MPRMYMPWPCLILLAFTAPAVASEVCELPARYGLSPAAIAITGVACNEHRLWMRAFIDSHGRLASLSISEAESEHLADHGLIAWQRVANYWRDSGTLAALEQTPGAASCQTLDGSRYNASDCRTFLIDNPWSAAFISWVMTQAGLATFPRSPRHIDYIRAAYQEVDSSPYRFADPASEKPAPGDLLCMLRDRDAALGYAGLRDALGSGAAIHWKSHCDIVIASNVGGDRTLYLIGGNVLNTVMMRKLPLDRTGRMLLPEHPPAYQAPANPDLALACSPGHEEPCDFNRNDWAALLKLRPEAALSAAPTTVMPGTDNAANPSTPGPSQITPAAAQDP